MSKILFRTLNAQDAFDKLEVLDVPDVLGKSEVI